MTPLLRCTRSCRVFAGIPLEVQRKRAGYHRQMPYTHRRFGDYNGTSPGFVSASASSEATSSAPTAKPQKLRSNFCRQCGGHMELAIPSGEKEWRHVCGKCGFVDYMNPKMVVGCIVEHEGQLLLCKRAIEPCRGLWTIPAGYMELNESSAEGAVRETWEEANAQVEVLAPYAHFDIPVIGQSYIIFRARLLPPFTFGCGEESLETVLMKPEDIPFDKVAFSSISIALRYYMDDMITGHYHVHHGVIEKRPGSSPNDPTSFSLRHHFAIPTSVRAADAATAREKL